MTKDNFPPLTQSDLNRLKTLNKDFINRNSQTIIKLIETENIEILSLIEDYLEYKLSQKTISQSEELNVMPDSIIDYNIISI